MLLKTTEDIVITAAVTGGVTVNVVTVSTRVSESLRVVVIVT